MDGTASVLSLTFRHIIRTSTSPLLKNTVFWGVISCSLLDSYRTLEELLPDFVTEVNNKGQDSSCLLSS